MVTAYKYQLQPYGPGQKRTCPECGKPKCYVQYMDTETQQLLPYEFGRCERINSCGYHKVPDGEYVKSATPAPPVEVKKQYVDTVLVRASLKAYDHNTFALWLTRTFGVKEAAKAIKRYHIGTAKNNGTLFWYRNIYGKFCNAKRIYYKPDGHRNKEIPPSYTHLTAKGFRLCLFGEHLLNENQKRNFAIVESEKTAVICSIYKPEFTWLSCGGANNLTHEKIRILEKKQGIIIPDADAAGRSSFATALSKLRCLPSFVEMIDMIPDANDGTDLADLLLMTPYSDNKILIGTNGYPAGWD